MAVTVYADRVVDVTQSAEWTDTSSSEVKSESERANDIEQSVINPETVSMDRVSDPGLAFSPPMEDAFSLLTEEGAVSVEGRVLESERREHWNGSLDAPNPLVEPSTGDATERIEPLLETDPIDNAVALDISLEESHRTTEGALSREDSQSFGKEPSDTVKNATQGQARAPNGSMDMTRSTLGWPPDASGSPALRSEEHGAIDDRHPADTETMRVSPEEETKIPLTNPTTHLPGQDGSTRLAHSLTQSHPGAPMRVEVEKVRSQRRPGLTADPGPGTSPHGPKVKTARIDPLKRGGRHRVIVNQERESAVRRTRPLELLCQRVGMGWQIVVEAPSKRAESSVTQGDQSLRRTVGGAWTIANLFEPVAFGAHTMRLAESWSTFRVFRLGEGGERGRSVASPKGRGDYLMVIPETWRVKCKEGAPRVTPQSVGLSGWRGSVISGLGGVNIEDEHGRIIAAFEAPEIDVQLRGKVAHAFDGPAPLYLGDVPVIEARWDQVAEVVVGLEGSAKNLWRRAVKTQNGQWPGLPPLPQVAGWYFLRFYDRLGNLLDSTSFFYVAGLESVEVRELKSGQSEIWLAYAPKWLTLDQAVPDARVTVQETPHGTKITVPAGPLWNRSVWSLRSQKDGSAVPLALSLPRVAWAIESEPTKEESLLWGGDVLTVPKISASPSSRWNLLISVSTPDQENIEIEVGRERSTWPLDAEGRAAIALRRWSAKVASEGQSIVLRMITSGRQYDVLRWVNRYRCQRCQEEAEERMRLFEHVRHRHPVEYEDVTDYDQYYELAAQMGMHLKIPSKVYRCPYCDELVRDDHYYPSGSMNTEMAHHQQSHWDQHSEAPPLSFTILDKVHEIEAAIQKNLPPIRRCKECGKSMPLTSNVWEEHEDAHYQKLILSD